MTKRIWTVGFMAMLAVLTSAWLSGAAYAGVSSVCGDGVIEGTEECDDSNTLDGDLCDSDCREERCGNGPPAQSELGEECEPPSAGNCDEACLFICGNGVVEAPEVCDTAEGQEGYRTNGDGCDDDPLAESPGNCTATACGNGVVAGGTPPETCDDGNTTPGDNCDGNCQIENVLPLTKEQQACVNEANKGAANVVKAQNKENGACLSGIAKGKVTTPYNTCLPSDPKGKVAGAKSKSDAGRTKKCVAPLPTFAFNPDGAAVNAAAMDAAIALATDIFGDPANVRLKSEKNESKCQAAFQKYSAKAFDTMLKEGLAAKKASIKGSKNDDPSQSNTELFIDILARLTGGSAISKTEKAVGNIGLKTQAQCSGVAGDVAGLFPGDCTASQAGAVADCAERQVVCRACEVFNTADQAGLDCDVVVQTVLADGTATCLDDL